MQMSTEQRDRPITNYELRGCILTQTLQRSAHESQ